MTRVDFYVTKDASARARPLVACRVAAKAFSLDHAVHIHTADRAEADALDQLLWTYRDNAFVPHALAGDPILAEPGAHRAVVIGWGEEPGEDCALIVNLARDVPDFFSRVERVAEIIDADPQRRQSGRERFKFYRDRGYPVTTHNL